MKVEKYGGIVGCAFQTWREPDRQSLEESLYAVTRRALADARMTIDDIDGIVVASNDQLDGRAIAIMAASGSVGGVGRDIMSTPSSAEHAFVLAALRIASGQYQTQLVVSWNPSETQAVSDVQRLGTDPYFHRPLPLDELSASALQANAMEAALPGLRETVLAIVAKNRRNGAMAHPELLTGPVEPLWIEAGKTRRWPLTDSMVAAPAAGAVALVLVSASWAAERGLQDVAWIRGMGWATEPGFPGDRDLAALPSLAAAAAQAYVEAEVVDPRESFDLAEITDATPYQELLAYEGLGLSPRTQWRESVAAGDFERDGSVPVNVSGGVLSFNPLYCAGLYRIAEVAQQMRGRAGTHQVAGAQMAVAHAASGFAMQYNTVVVMGNERAGELQ